MQTDNPIPVWHFNLDRGEDRTIVLQRTVAGSPDNLSAATVQFVVKDDPTLSFEPTIDVEDANKRILEFSPTYVAALDTRREYYVLLTYPDGLRDIILKGTVTPTGWVA